MKLIINAVGHSDYGTYKCVSKNSLGDTDGTVQVYGELFLLPINIDFAKNRFFNRTIHEKSH